jgi:hypothetical protein
VVDSKRIIGKNGGPRRRRGTRGCWPPKRKTFSKQGSAIHCSGIVVSGIVSAWGDCSFWIVQSNPASV